MQSYILDSNNTRTTCTIGGATGITDMSGLPLGKTAGGEVFLKTGASLGATGTFTNQSVGASSSVTIPMGARNWSVTVLTGTATIGSATALPAGFSDSDTGPLNAGLVVTTDAASSAYIQYLV